MKTTITAVAMLCVTAFAHGKEEYITSVAIGANTPDRYEFFTDTHQLKKYFTDSALIPCISITPQQAALKTIAAIEKAYGVSPQHMPMMRVFSTVTSSQLGKRIWYYELFPQWNDAQGRIQEIPVLVLPNGKVLLPRKK